MDHEYLNFVYFTGTGSVLGRRKLDQNEEEEESMQSSRHHQHQRSGSDLTGEKVHPIHMHTKRGKMCVWSSGGHCFFPCRLAPGVPGPDDSPLSIRVAS